MARSGLEVQKAAVKALFLREIKTRFGKFRLGYLWAALEPMAHMLILLGIFGYVMHRTMPDISFPVFLINGIIPFFVFSNITNRSIGAIEANQGLFNYRPVRPVDTIIARAMLEALIYAVVYVLLMAIVGLLILALVVLAPGTTATEDELREHCRTRLAGYKVPKRIEFRTELARTATGKLQKFKLRAPSWEGHERQVN